MLSKGFMGFERNGIERGFRYHPSRFYSKVLSFGIDGLDTIQFFPEFFINGFEGDAFAYIHYYPKDVSKSKTQYFRKRYFQLFWSYVSKNFEQCFNTIERIFGFERDYLTRASKVISSVLKISFLCFRRWLSRGFERDVWRFSKQITQSHFKGKTMS